MSIADLVGYYKARLWREPRRHRSRRACSTRADRDSCPRRTRRSRRPPSQWKPASARWFLQRGRRERHGDAPDTAGAPHRLSVRRESAAGVEPELHRGPNRAEPRRDPGGERRQVQDREHGSRRRRRSRRRVPSMSSSMSSATSPATPARHPRRRHRSRRRRRRSLFRRDRQRSANRCS